MAVAMCALPSNCIPPMNDRFYKFETPSPQSEPQHSPIPVEYQSPQCYPATNTSELEDSGFRSDEEIQKVRHLPYLSVPDSRKYEYNLKRARLRPPWLDS